MAKRTRGWRLPFALLALNSVFLTTALAGSAPSSAPPDNGIVVVKVPSTDMAGFGSRHDFGPISTERTPRLEHTFTLRNGGTAALTIVRLQPSCGCTSAVLAGTGRLPAILKPGQQIPIQVKVNLEPHLAGPFRKTVAVYVAEQAAPAAVLEMIATLNALAVTATPATLDFGQTSYGKVVRLPFTLHAWTGTTPVALAVSLACSSPDITLSLMPPTPQDGPGTISGVAILSDRAHLGRLQGQILVLSPAADAASLAVLPIQGEVIGDIAASPAALSWDATADQPFTRRITLTARTPEALRGLRVSCASRALTVRLEASSLPSTAALSVTLTPVAAGRHITARIIVTTATGQRLLIPISAGPSPDTATNPFAVAAPGGS